VGWGEEEEGGGGVSRAAVDLLAEIQAEHAEGMARRTWWQRFTLWQPPINADKWARYGVARMREIAEEVAPGILDRLSGIPDAERAVMCDVSQPRCNADRPQEQHED